MHDIRAIRDNPEAFDAALARRGLAPMAGALVAMDAERRARITAAETAQAEQNRASKEVGAAKARGDEAEFERLRALVAEKKAEVARLHEEAGAEQARLDAALAGIPNLPRDDVPEGADEAGNVEIRRWGNPRNFAFEPKEHFELAGVQPGLDLGVAAKLSGSRFMVLKGAVARLHRALAQFMLDMHVTEHGLSETWTPVLVRDEAMYGTGQLPKFAEDSYRTTNGWWLIPTSEVTLTNLPAGEILDAGSLPMRMCAHSQCFRSEAGSAGKDTTGILRQHQFEKVEMVTICTPEAALEEHERMTRCAEAVLERLGLPYRTVVLCTGDMGFGAREDPRHRGLAAGAGDLSRDQFGFDLRAVPGAADERALPAGGGGEARLRGDAERIGPGGGAGADRGAGERAGGGRLGHAARGAGAVAGRRAADHGGRRAGLSRRVRGRAARPHRGGSPRRGPPAPVMALRAIPPGKGAVPEGLCGTPRRLACRSWPIFSCFLKRPAP
jgi:seryl-tRNA synthetase